MVRREGLCFCAFCLLMKSEQVVRCENGLIYVPAKKDNTESLLWQHNALSALRKTIVV